MPITGIKLGLYLMLCFFKSVCSLIDTFSPIAYQVQVAVNVVVWQISRYFG